MIDFRELASALGCRLTRQDINDALTVAVDQSSGPPPVRPVSIRLRVNWLLPAPGPAALRRSDPPSAGTLESREAGLLRLPHQLPGTVDKGLSGLLPPVGSPSVAATRVQQSCFGARVESPAIFLVLRMRKPGKAPPQLSKLGFSTVGLVRD